LRVEGSVGKKERGGKRWRAYQGVRRRHAKGGPSSRQGEKRHFFFEIQKKKCVTPMKEQGTPNQSGDPGTGKEVPTEARMAKKAWNLAVILNHHLNENFSGWTEEKRAGAQGTKQFSRFSKRKGGKEGAC